jgi:hypothetical protein
LSFSFRKTKFVRHCMSFRSRIKSL